MLKRKLTHLEAHAIAHRLHQAEEIVAGVVAELAGMEDCPHGVDDGACKQCYGEAVRGEQWTAEAKCKACNGNDGDAPCAYPEGHPDCLRNASASTLGETVQGKPMATTAEFDVAIETLRHVIECLRNTGRYTDEEGEATDFLEPLLYAHLSAQQPQAAEPKGLTDEQIESLAHRHAYRYRHGPDSIENIFNRNCLLNFARALLAKGK